MQTYTGRVIHPRLFHADDINIIDIAHALAFQCRYAGHCHCFYSVAEHSVLVSILVPSRYALWGLLHDAAEAYIADIPRAWKNKLMDYVELQEEIMRKISKKFLDETEEPPVVKEVDRNICKNEMHYLFNDHIFTERPYYNIEIHCWKPEKAFLNFLARFNRLWDTR